MAAQGLPHQVRVPRPGPLTPSQLAPSTFRPPLASPALPCGRHLACLPASCARAPAPLAAPCSCSSLGGCCTSPPLESRPLSQARMDHPTLLPVVPPGMGDGGRGWRLPFLTLRHVTASSKQPARCHLTPRGQERGQVCGTQSQHPGNAASSTTQASAMVSADAPYTAWFQSSTREGQLSPWAPHPQ